MVQLLNLLLDGSIHERLKKVTDSLSRYVDSESKYTSYFLTVLAKHVTVVLILSLIAFGFFQSLLISGVFLLFSTGEIYPNQDVFLYLILLFAVLFVAVIAFAIRAVFKIKAAFKNFQSHWSMS